MSIHIHRGPSPTIATHLDCPVCDGRVTPFVGHAQEWYDTIWTCTRCGDSWTCEGRDPRPFERGWRQRAQRRARGAWYDAVLAGGLR